MPRPDAPHARIAPTAIATTGGREWHIYHLPTFCPRCRQNCIPTVLGHAAVSILDDGPVEYTINVPLSCSGCNAAFIGEYFGAKYTAMDFEDDSLEFVGTIPAAEAQTIVSDVLTKISPQFAKVYDEAVAAQAAGLEELSGAGYRRALEFLVGASGFQVDLGMRSSPPQWK